MQSHNNNNTGTASQCNNTTIATATTMPRKRRPRRAVGEVSISSASCVYVNNAPTSVSIDATDVDIVQHDQLKQQSPFSSTVDDPVYANSMPIFGIDEEPLLQEQPSPPRRRNRTDASFRSLPLVQQRRQNAPAPSTATVRRNFSVVLRQRDKPLTETTDICSSSIRSTTVEHETQHITIFIGEQLQFTNTILCTDAEICTLYFNNRYDEQCAI